MISAQGMVDVGKQGQKKMAGKIKFPYNLQPIGKYLRQAEYNISPGTVYCLDVNALLEGKTTLA